MSQRRIYIKGAPENSENAPDYLKKPILNQKEAAAYLKRSPRLVRELAQAGVIPCRKLPRGKSGRNAYFFTRESLDRWAGGETP